MNSASADSVVSAFVEFSSVQEMNNACAIISSQPDLYGGLLAIPKIEHLKNQKIPKKPPKRDEMNWREEAKPGSFVSPPAYVASTNAPSPGSVGISQSPPLSNAAIPVSTSQLDVARKKIDFKNYDPSGKPQKLVERTSVVVKTRCAKGPDGTKGFAAGRGRHLPSSAKT